MMSVYDDILAELKITNGELQVIRVALERIDQRAGHPSPVRGEPVSAHYQRCNVFNCTNKPELLVGMIPYCAAHAPEQGRHTRCNAPNNCTNKPIVLINGGSPYCAEHAARLIVDPGVTSIRNLP